MTLIIDIQEEDYEIMKHNITVNNPLCPLSQEEMVFKVANGKPLPKGHGRLIDADRTLATAWTNFYKHEDEWEKKDPDYVPLGRFYNQNGFECCQQTIVNAPTIIDKDGEE